MSEQPVSRGAAATAGAGLHSASAGSVTEKGFNEESAAPTEPSGKVGTPGHAADPGGASAAVVGESHPVYDAFISYRQVEPDRTWAKWLHRALETYRTPRALIKRGIAKRLRRVFRDTDELRAVPELNTALVEALRNSRFLIVVASKRSSESRWINAEIAEFIRLGRREFILPLLIDGTPEEAFPPALRLVGEVGNEPLAADVRDAKGLLKGGVRKRALLKLIAPLLGCELDDLVQRELERTRKRRAFALAGLVSLAVFGAGLTLLFQQQRVFELSVYSLDGLGGDRFNRSRLDPSRSLLLSRIAFNKSDRFLGVGKDMARASLERALIEDPLRAMVRLPDRAVRGLAWGESGIAAAGGNGHLRIWDRNSGSIRAELDLGGDRVDSLAYRPGTGSRQLALGGGRRVVYIWDITKNEPRELSTGATMITQPPSAVAWCSDGERLAGTDGDHTVLIWDLRTPHVPPRTIVPSEGEEIGSIAWNKSCSALVIGGRRGIYLWHGDTNAVQKVGTHNPDALNAMPTRAEGSLSVSWSPDETKFASGGQDGAVIVSEVARSRRSGRRVDVEWLAADQISTRSQGNHDDRVEGVAWSPDGSQLASASQDRTVRIWERGRFSFVYRFSEIVSNQEGSWSVAWSPDGKELATGGYDGTIKVWRVSGDPERAVLNGRSGDLTIERRQSRDPTAPQDYDKILLFDGKPLDDAQLHELARQRSVRQLTDKECMQYLRETTCPALR